MQLGPSGCLQWWPAGMEASPTTTRLKIRCHYQTASTLAVPPLAAARPTCGHSGLAIGIPIPAIRSSGRLAEIAARCRRHGSAFPEKSRNRKALAFLKSRSTRLRTKAIPTRCTFLRAVARPAVRYSRALVHHVWQSDSAGAGLHLIRHRAPTPPPGLSASSPLRFP